MSHYFYLHCPKCNLSSDDTNRGGDLLRDAVAGAGPLIAAYDAGWDVSAAGWNHGQLHEIGGYIIAHRNCGELELRDEYADFDKPFPKLVIPK